MRNFFWVFGIITTLFLIFNTLFYLICFKKKKKVFRIFCLYLILMSGVQILSIFIGKVLHKPNLFLSHFYFISQFLILSFFYYHLLKSKIVFLIIIPVFLFLGYQYLFDHSLVNKYNVIGIALTQLILMIYSILYLYRSLNGEAEFLIVNIGLFLYLISSTLIFASGNLVFNEKISEALNFLLVNLKRILYFVFQILIFIEWRKNYYKKTLRS